MKIKVKTIYPIVLHSFIFMLLCLLGNAIAYDDVETHPRITKRAIENSNVNKYLIQNLGFKDGIETKVPANTNNTIRFWLEEGSKLEDTPLCRASNHFHNPLKLWNQSGVSDQPELIRDWCSYSGYPIKYSNVTWATGYLSPASNGSKTTIENQEMGWNDAREYYHLALTSPLSADREANFARTFQSLGQVIHLIEDMAVPAHTRNDFSAHLYFQDSGFRNPTTWFGNSFEWYVKQNPSLVTGSKAVHIDFTNAGVTRFWDTDVYDGSSRLTDTSLGLAEYTNANFFSDYTIFAESKDPRDVHYFPLPAESDTNAFLVEQQAEDGTIDKVYYVKPNGEDYKLAAYSYFHWWKNLLPYWGWAYGLDDEVHKDYAQELIPRAIGYSAGLLNYFFRGELEVVQNFYPDSITITNKSSEKMDGTFTLYYDAADGDWKPVSDGSWSLILDSGNTSNELNFTEPTDLGEDRRYILVFKGTFGNELNAVIGKIYQSCTDEFKLIAHDAAADDWFGESVAISGDVAIIGVPYDDDAGYDSGSAYVFVRNGERWEVQAKLTASDASPDDWFGYSVAMSGDVAIVGSPYDDDAGYDSGSAYVFVRNGERWEEQAKLTASDTTEFDIFGYSVAIDKDVVIVGAYSETSDFGNASGSAYIFIRNGGRWEEQAKLTASDAEEYDFFGWSVAISGDVAIIGAPNNGIETSVYWSWSGAVYVFARNGERWEERAKLTASDGAAGDRFGWSVAISGDNVIVGSPWDKDAAEHSGSAYIFVRNGETWEEQKKLTASDAAAYDFFGWSAAMGEDVAIVGSLSTKNAAGKESGAAYIFMHNGGMWEENKKLTPGDAVTDMWFGEAVAIDGDVAIVGAPYNDNDEERSGDAYIKYYNACSP